MLDIVYSLFQHGKIGRRQHVNLAGENRLSLVHFFNNSMYHDARMSDLSFAECFKCPLYRSRSVECAWKSRMKVDNWNLSCHSPSSVDIEWPRARKYVEKFSAKDMH